LNIAINCFGICGDADNDGDPGHTSTALLVRGGVDTPDFNETESCTIMLDLGSPASAVPDGVNDIVFGYPGGFARDSDMSPNATCNIGHDISCFALYLVDSSGGLQPDAMFLWKATAPLMIAQTAPTVSLIDHFSGVRVSAAR
jgi:hypothetical protein